MVPWKQRTRLAMNIATVFGQRSQLWFHLPAGETFNLLARIYEIPAAEFRARRDDLVRRFELEPLLGTAVRKLSLGQRMRCEIAASLLHRPRVLFLDEPTIGLDVVAKQEIRSFIRELNRRDGVTVLLTSHDAGDIEHLCKRVVIINHGMHRLRRSRERAAAKVHPAEAGELPPAGADRTRCRCWMASRCSPRADSGSRSRSTRSGQPIAEVMAALGDLPLADITIEDPPIEEIIAAIYRDQAGRNRPRRPRPMRRRPAMSGRDHRRAARPRRHRRPADRRRGLRRRRRRSGTGISAAPAGRGS